MTRPRVLVAEDDPGMLAWLTDVLTEQEVEVIAARSGVEVLHHINNDALIAMAIVDVHMPPPSGLRVVALARLSGFRRPFLLITAFPDEALQKWAAAMEGVSLLAKPFEAGQLFGAIQRLGGLRPASGSSWPVRGR